jgi:Raf kinase inhibitor-like YbhB/YbcL family protein
MRFHSTAFDDGGEIPPEHTGEGADRSPPLAWDTVPAAMRSLALVVDDPDSTSGEFTHWVLYDLPPTVRELPDGFSGAQPRRFGLEGRNDFGTDGYRGPMPPAGQQHRYVFTLYALDTRPTLPPGATKDELLAAIDGHVLQSADITGRYARSVQTTS